MTIKPEGLCNKPPKKGTQKKNTEKAYKAEISGSADNMETSVTERNNETY